MIFRPFIFQVAAEDLDGHVSLFIFVPPKESRSHICNHKHIRGRHYP